VPEQSEQSPHSRAQSQNWYLDTEPGSQYQKNYEQHGLRRFGSSLENPNQISTYSDYRVFMAALATLSE
jgi:hypothetical protein